MTARIMGGTYYATGYEPDPRNAPALIDVARQTLFMDEARRALEDSGRRGYVERRDPRTGERSVVAEFDEAGNWWAYDPFRGRLYAMDPPARKTAQGSA